MLRNRRESQAVVTSLESQLLLLARKARQENQRNGQLWQSSSDREVPTWRPIYAVLYQNLFFIYPDEREALRTLSRNLKPTSVWLLEGCSVEKLLPGSSPTGRPAFTVSFGDPPEPALMLASANESDADAWMEKLSTCSYWHVNNEYLSFKERYEMATQVLETEKISRWNCVVQLEDAHEEVKRLRWALANYQVGSRRVSAATISDQGDEQSMLEDAAELRCIRKAQSLMRGWLCRHRWKSIVDVYVKSPDAEKMRHRNRVIFRMVKEEREHVDNLSLLVSSFLQPLRMAASSSCGGGSASLKCKCKHSDHTPGTLVITHEEVSAIFLNCQTLLFLHQIFLQGLATALEKWPQLLIGDVFKLLLPALSVYTEYVRNHYVSVQTLAELKMTRPTLACLIRQMEVKNSDGNSTNLEQLLTCPMNQIPRYIVNFHELLAYTVQHHIDRPNLEIALTQLEDLSLQMSTEMSESEHIRKNLAIERMLGDGGHVLLDPEEVLVRQGSLLQLDQSCGLSVKLMASSRLFSAPPSPDASSTSDAPQVHAAARTVFLFSHYIIITTRGTNGKLSLVKHTGIISLGQCMLIVDPSSASPPGQSVDSDEFESSQFTLVPDSGNNGPIMFQAASLREKQLWCSDITQCLEKIRFDQIVAETRRFCSEVSSFSSTSTAQPSVTTSNQKTKAKSKSTGSPKSQNQFGFSRPKVKQVSMEILMKCLSDFRLQAGDFVNVFLATYRLFTSSDKVMAQLVGAYHYWRQHGTEVLEELQSTSRSSHSRHSSPYRDFPYRSTRASHQSLATSQATSRQSTPVLHHLSRISERKGDLTKAEPSDSSATNYQDIDNSLANSSTRTSLASLNHFARQRTESSIGSSSVFEGIQSPTTASLAASQNESEVSIIEEATRLLNKPANAGMVVFSVSKPRRRMSSAMATQAFAKATAGALDLEVGRLQKEREKQLEANQRLYSAQCLNIFNIVRHWSIMFPEDFASGQEVGEAACSLLREMSYDNVSLNQSESAAACKLLRHLAESSSVESNSTRDNWVVERVAQITMQPQSKSPPGSPASSVAPPSNKTLSKAASCSKAFDSLAAIDIAEQMTLIDSLMFRSVKLSEVYNQAWTKSTKERDAPNVTLISRHFNHVSSLVVTNIVSQATPAERAAALKKWLLVATTCSGMRNFNGALQIISAMQSSSVFRLKKTWDKLSRHNRQVFDKLANQLSSENRFKKLRETLSSIDPPCTPYLGMYLQDLTQVNESCPTFVNDYLVNFSKMKMIYQLVSDIQAYQSVPYTIAVKQQIIDLLIDRSLVLDEESSYRLSLADEPRQHIAR